MISKLKIVFLLLFLLPCLYASSQFTEKIETDRPDQTESPYVIPKNYFQAEIGFNKENFSGKNYRIVHPTALLKYGLHNKFELRLELNSFTDYIHQIPNSTTTPYFDPVEIGTKISFWEQKGLLPKTSLISHLGLPFIASKTLKSNPANYTFRLTMQNAITDRFGIGYNVGVNGGGGEEAILFYTVAPGLSIGDKWYAYIEAFGDLKKNGSLHHLDGGLAYYINNDWKLDISAGVGLGDAELKNYSALGISFRIPTK